MKKNWKHEIEITFENKYYNIVRSVVDNFRTVNLIGIANGKGIFNSGILVTEQDDITTIRFKVRKGELNWRLCIETFNDMKEFEIVKTFVKR